MEIKVSAERKEKLQAIRQRVIEARQKAGRKAREVQLLAVSKTKPWEMVAELSPAFDVLHADPDVRVIVLASALQQAKTASACKRGAAAHHWAPATIETMSGARNASTPATGSKTSV